MKLQLIEINGSYNQSVTINSSDSFQTISITNFVTQSTGQLKVQLNNNAHVAVVYVDEIILEKV